MTTMHIDEKRLFELTRMDYIFEQPEWVHIRTCEECLDKFADCVDALLCDPDDEASQAS